MGRCLWPLALYYYLWTCVALQVSPAGASVALEGFGKCGVFFYMRTPPVGIGGGGGGSNNLRRICQRYGDQERYATLYHAGRRLAVYSAYTFKKTDGRGRMDTPWMYEPQLASADESSSMRTLPPPGGETPPLLEESQAVLEDYVDAVEYERATLNPDQHQADPDDKSSTYTLTNVVPLVTDFLEGPWTAHTHAIRRRLNNFCLGPAYLLTGVTVAGGSIRRRRGSSSSSSSGEGGGEPRLAVPEMVWSAYCCPRYDRNAPYEVRYMFPTYAAYGRNQKGQRVLEVPLKSLENLLRNHADMEPNLALFYRGCVAESTDKKKK